MSDTIPGGPSLSTTSIPTPSAPPSAAAGEVGGIMLQDRMLFNLTGEPITFLVIGSPDREMTVESHGGFVDIRVFHIDDETKVYISGPEKIIKWNVPIPNQEVKTTVIVPSGYENQAFNYLHRIAKYRSTHVRVISPSQYNRSGTVTSFFYY